MKGWRVYCRGHVDWKSGGLESIEGKLIERVERWRVLRASGLKERRVGEYTYIEGKWIERRVKGEWNTRTGITGSLHPQQKFFQLRSSTTLLILVWLMFSKKKLCVSAICRKKKQSSVEDAWKRRKSATVLWRHICNILVDFLSLINQSSSC